MKSKILLPEQDHREIGKKHALFYFSEYGPGFPFWLDKGLKIKKLLLKYWRELHEEAEYLEIESPMMLDEELWKISGHVDYFKENMFFSDVEKRNFAIKPMSCPGAMLVFNSQKRSHRELPMRICEVGHVHRNENSGSLNGILRARAFSQDDGHIFCSKEQLAKEIEGIIGLIEKVIRKCGFDDFHFELSVRGADISQKKKFLGHDDDWKIAEEALLKAARVKNYSPIIKEGEAKFYGPSLDLHIKDRNGKNWQCSTIQLDFNLAERFNVHYFGRDGERLKPFILHRAIFGSLERFMGILLENHGMELPFWMQPEQVRILCLDDSSFAYGKRVKNKLSPDYRCKLLKVEENLNQDIKAWRKEKIPMCIVLGEREVKEKKVNIRVKKNKPISIKLEELEQFFKQNF